MYIRGLRDGTFLFCQTSLSATYAPSKKGEHMKKSNPGTVPIGAVQVLPSETLQAPSRFGSPAMSALSTMKTRTSLTSQLLAW